MLQGGGGLIVVSTYRSFFSILLPQPQPHPLLLMLMVVVVVEIVKRIMTTARWGRRGVVMYR